MSSSCAVSLSPTCCRSAAPSPSAGRPGCSGPHGGLVRLDLTANPDKLQGLVRQLAARDGAATIP
jgi:hypothetical protein